MFFLYTGPHAVLILNLQGNFEIPAARFWNGGVQKWGQKWHKSSSLSQFFSWNPSHGPEISNSPLFHIYINFWYSKRHGVFPQLSDLHPLNVKKLGFGTFLGPNPAPGTVLAPKTSVPAFHALTKCVAGKKLGLVILAHFLNSCCDQPWMGSNPKPDFGSTTKTRIFKGEDDRFRRFFFEFSESAVNFGLRTWGSDWSQT